MCFNQKIIPFSKIIPVHAVIDSFRNGFAQYSQEIVNIYYEWNLAQLKNLWKFPPKKKKEIEESEWKIIFI